MRATYLLALMLLAPTGSAADPKDELTPQRRQELKKKAQGLSEQGEQHYQRGDYPKAKEAFRQALELNRALYPREQFPQGHPDLLECLGWLGFLHRATEEYGQAE